MNSQKKTWSISHVLLKSGRIRQLGFSLAAWNAGASRSEAQNVHTSKKGLPSVPFICKNGIFHSSISLFHFIYCGDHLISSTANKDTVYDMVTEVKAIISWYHHFKKCDTTLLIDCDAQGEVTFVSLFFSTNKNIIHLVCYRIPASFTMTIPVSNWWCTCQVFFLARTFQHGNDRLKSCSVRTTVYP